MRKNKFKEKPDFICIGYHKSGTNWLFKNLGDHPEFCLPPIKELDYLLEGAKIPKYTLKSLLFDQTTIHQYKSMRLLAYLKNKNRWTPKSNKFFLRYFLFRHTDDWYSSLFDSKKISGDISPSYTFLSKKAVRDVSIRYPNAKIVIILREPVSRIWSLMKMNINRKAQISNYSNAELLELSNDLLREQVEYLTVLKRWTKYFENVLILCYDEIIENPSNFMSKVHFFLGANNVSFESTFQKKIVYKGSKDQIPEKLKRHLTEYYYPIIKDLYEEHKISYIKRWHDEYSNVLFLKE